MNAPVSFDPIARALAGLRTAPPAVDVAARVMARVARLPRPEREEVPLRQAGSWALAAALVGAAALGVFAARGVAWRPAFSEIAAQLAAAAGALKLAGAAVVEAVGAACRPATLALWQVGDIAAERLEPWGSVARGTIVFAALATLATVSIVVSRGWRRAPILKER